MPKDYGIERKELESWQKQRRDGLPTLKYSSSRKLDEKSFWDTWKNLSVDLTKTLRILTPVHTQLGKS